MLSRLAAIITRGGAVPGIQLAHAGRKASTTRTWEGSKPIAPGEGGWVPVAPSPISFHPGAVDPHALSTTEIADIAGAVRHQCPHGPRGGHEGRRIHAAHGYLLHSFLSPISNHRNDAYGGDLEGRSRFLMETLDAVRAEWPADLPLFVRLSCVDYLPGGLTIEDTVALARKLAARGDVDLIDCSSGGVSPDARIPTHPGYQVPFADAVKHGANIATGAVGLITEPTHAAEIVGNDRADLVFVARAAGGSGVAAARGQGVGGEAGTAAALLAGDPGLTPFQQFPARNPTPPQFTTNSAQHRRPVMET